MAVEKTETRNNAAVRFKDASAGFAVGAVGGIASVRDSEDMGTEADLLRRHRPSSTSNQLPQPELAISNPQPAVFASPCSCNVLHHPGPDTRRAGLPYVTVPTRS